MLAAIAPDAHAPLRLAELPSLPLARGEVRVRVRAIGVNPVDWKMRGLGPIGVAERLVGPRGPLVVGMDFAGDVTEVSPDAKGVSVGDRVVGATDFSRGQRGAYADEVVVRPDQCATLPAGVSYESAASLPVPGVTARRHLLHIGRIDAKPLSRVLVLGASGGVGLIAVQLARALHAKPVGVCSSRNRALVERLGAEVIAYDQGDALSNAKAQGPYELIINAVGTSAYPVDACVDLLTPTGRLGLVVVGLGDFSTLLLRRRVRSVLGRPTREHLEPLVSALASGDLEAVIDARLPLAQAAEAHERSRTGKVVGKLILVP